MQLLVPNYQFLLKWGSSYSLVPGVITTTAASVKVAQENLNRKLVKSCLHTFTLLCAFISVLEQKDVWRSR